MQVNAYPKSSLKVWTRLYPKEADLCYICKLKWPDLTVWRNIHWILWETHFQDISLEITGNGNLCRRVIHFSFRIRICQVLKRGTEIARLGWIHCPFITYISQGDMAHPADENSVLHHLSLMFFGALNNGGKGHRPMIIQSHASLFCF